MIPAVFVSAAVIALATVSVWGWRLQTRALRAIVPGADLSDVVALCDLPLASTLGSRMPPATGPMVHLLGLTREAASLFVAYRSAASSAAKVATLLLDVRLAGNRELATLARWRSVRTPVVVSTDPVGGEVAIQEPVTGLTVTLPLLD